MSEEGPAPGPARSRTGLAARAEALAAWAVPVPLAEGVVVALIASILAACVAVPFALALPLGPPRFGDIIGSEFPLYNKNRDLLFVVVWLVLFTAFALPALRLGPVRRWAADVTGRLGTLGDRPFVMLAFAVWVVVTGLVASTATQSALGDGALLNIAAFESASYVLALLPLILYRPRPEGASRSDVAVAAGCVFAGVLGAVSLVAIVIGGQIPVVGGAGARLLIVPVLLGVSLVVRVFASDPQKLRRLTLASQVFVPLLLTGAFLSFVDAGGSIIRAPTAGWLVAIGLLSVALAVLAALRRARGLVGQAGVEPLSTLTVACVGAFMALRLTPPSALFLADDFHLGENLIQWQQFFGFGKEPFRSLVPIPGLSGTLYGAVNTVVGDTAGSFGRAVGLVWVMVALISAWLMGRVVGPRRALLLVPLAAVILGSGLISTDRYLFVVPSALVLLLPELTSRRLLWIVCWAGLSVFNVLLIAGTGLAFALAGTPAVLCQLVLWRRARSGTAWRSPYLWAGAVVAAATALAFPAFIAALRSSVAQARSNSLAWGTPLFDAHLDPALRVRFVAVDIVRLSSWWMGIPVAVMILLAALRSRRNNPGEGTAAVWATSLVVFVLAMTPYCFGRIDHIGLSRSGGMALVVMGIGLPVALFLRSPGELTKRSVRGFALFAAVAFGLQGLPQANLLGRASLVLPVGEVRSIDGPAIGFAGLGATLAPARPWHTPGAEQGPIEPIAAVIDGLLEEGETFLDLTNRQALYQYSEREVPGQFAAFVYAASAEDQIEMVDRLAEDPPPLALLSGPADNVLGLPQLRSYRVWRRLMESGYLPFEHEGQRFLVSPDRLDRAGEAGFTRLTFPDLDFDQTDPAWSDLPRAWGTSFEDMEWRFRESDWALASSEPGSLKFTPRGQTRTDFLLLSMDCPARGSSEVALRWVDSAGASHEAGVSAGDRTLVPLGAQASWSAAEGIVSLEVTVVDGTCVADSLRSEGLFRLLH